MGLVNTIQNRDALEVAKEIGKEKVRLVYCDGPYGLEFGDWDMSKGQDLVEWYRPFFDSFEDICLPSASVVIWGRSDSWAWLHCELLNRGWEFAGSCIWNKGVGANMMSSPDMIRAWPQTHEHFGIYRRNELGTDTCAATTVAYAAGASEDNWIRLWLRQQWLDAGLTLRQADEALGTKGMAGHYFNASQWCLPTLEAYLTLGEYAQKHGKERDGLDWLVHPDCSSANLETTHEHLTETWSYLLKTHEYLRDEYEKMRAPFNWPKMMGSVWKERTPTLTATRHGHPCEKPPSLTRKLIEVLTNPGDLVFEPFGGSSPVARCCEAMPEEKKRQYISCELDADYVARTNQMLGNLQGMLF